MINTTDLTCTVANTIDSFVIEWGSDRYVDMIQTPYLRMACLGWTAQFNVMQAIGQEVSIMWRDTATGINWNLYTGVIRSINVSDEGNGVYVYNIDAEAPWNYLGIKEIGGNGYPAALDGNRIDAILADAGAYSWNDIDPGVDWATMTTAWYGLSWLQWPDSVDLYVGTVTGTDTYVFDAYDGGAQTAMSLLDQQSADCRGRFYAPWSSGYLYWKSYTDVAALLDAPLFTIDGANEIIDGTLSADGTVANIYNVVSLSDGINAPTAVSDTTSINTYGIRTLDIQTNIAGSNRLGLATNLLAISAQIRSNLTGFRIQTTGWDYARGQDFLTDCISGSLGAATVTGIPDVFGGDQNILITGGVMVYDGSDTVFELKCQTANEVAAVEMWSQVDVSYTWATYLPNNIWSEAS